MLPSKFSLHNGCEIENRRK
uniref:Uncharacterized protein n=1 Tax=Anopheles christyi TaxID=43041 RepID=A0A182KIP2_9DIPT